MSCAAPSACRSGWGLCEPLNRGRRATGWARPRAGAGVLTVAAPKLERAGHIRDSQRRQRVRLGDVPGRMAREPLTGAQPLSDSELAKLRRCAWRASRAHVLVSVRHGLDQRCAGQGEHGGGGGGAPLPHEPRSAHHVEQWPQIPSCRDVRFVTRFGKKRIGVPSDRPNASGCDSAAANADRRTVGRHAAQGICGRVLR